MEKRKEKKDSRLAKNYLYNLAYHIFTIITPLITTPYISRALGSENIGIYGYVESICAYFIVMGNMGFPLYGQREIAYYADDTKKRSQRFVEIMIGKTLFLLISIVLYIGYVAIFAKDNKIIFYSYTLGMVADVIHIGWYYQGIEEFRITVARNFFIKIATVISIFIFVKTENDLLKYSILINAANLLGNVLIIFGLKNTLDLKDIRIRISEVFKHVKPAFILAIPYYITKIYAVLDKTILGSISGNYSEVGYYEQSQKIVVFALSIVTSLGVVFLPRIANEVANNNRDAIKSYLNRGIEAIMLLSFPILAGLLLIGDMMVPWFFGDGYEKVGSLIKIFSPLALIMGLSNLVGNQFLIASKREKHLTLSIASGVVINVILNFILVYKYQSIGVAIATVISEFCKLILVFIFVNQEIDFSVFAKNIISYLVSAGIMFAAGLFSRNIWFSDFTFTNTLFIILICAFVYLSCLFMTKNNLLLSILNRLIKSKFQKQ